MTKRRSGADQRSAEVSRGQQTLALGRPDLYSVCVFLSNILFPMKVELLSTNSPSLSLVSHRV